MGKAEEADAGGGREPMASGKGASQKEGTARAKGLGFALWAQRTVWKWVRVGQQIKDRHVYRSQVVGETLWLCRHEDCGFVSE